MREIPFRADNSVSEMWILPAWVMPRVIDANTGRMTKLRLPTEVKLGASRVAKAVKLSNSNVPLILCKPEAVKEVIDEVRLTVTSPVTCSTPKGIETDSIETSLMMMLPVTVEQPWSASRSL